MTVLSPVAAAVRGYAAAARAALGSDTAPVVSYAGIWLLLAGLATALDDDPEAPALLGMPAAQARAAADRLCAEPGVVHARIGGWLAQAVQLIGEPPIALERGLDRARLDRWAAEATDGMIDTFPLRLRPDTAIVVASALALAPQWSRPLEDLGGDRLALRDSGRRTAGRQTVADTVAAGPVAVVAPPTGDGVDVYSIVAAPRFLRGGCGLRSTRYSMPPPRARWPTAGCPRPTGTPGGRSPLPRPSTPVPSRGPGRRSGMRNCRAGRRRPTWM